MPGLRSGAGLRIGKSNGKGNSKGKGNSNDKATATAKQQQRQQQLQGSFASLRMTAKTGNGNDRVLRFAQDDDDLK
jgi:hypothetical protein